MGDIEVDRIKLKEASKKKKDGEKIAKAAQKKLNKEKKRNKDKLSREICKATMKDLSKKGEAHISKLTVPVLKDLIRFVSDQTSIRKQISKSLGGLCTFKECTPNILAIIYQLNIQQGYCQQKQKLWYPYQTKTRTTYKVTAIMRMKRVTFDV